MISALADLIERLERRETDTALQHLLHESLQGIADRDVLHALAHVHFHSMAIGLPIMERLIELEPHSDEVLAMLAGLYAMHLEVEPAREWAKRALSINAESLEAMYALSSTSFDPQVRLTDADAMLAIDAHYYPAVRHKADALQSLGRHDEAADIWRRHLDWLRKSATPNTSQISAAEAGLAQAYDDPDAAARAIEVRVFGTGAAD